jgi:hypothetical protein
MSGRREHLSQFTIDAVALGQLDGALRSSADQHLADCGACSARLEAIRADNAAASAAATAAPPAWLESRTVGQGRRRNVARQRRLGSAALGLGFAAAAVAVVASQVGDPTPPDPPRSAGESRRGGDGRHTRAKGRVFSVLAHVERVSTGEVLEFEEGVSVEPGDRVQLAYTAPEAGFLTVTSRDETGHVTVYHAAGSGSAPATAGVDVPLPFSIELDAAAGVEIVQVTWCREPISLESLATGPGPPAGCAAAELRLTRSAR